MRHQSEQEKSPEGLRQKAGLFPPFQTDFNFDEDQVYLDAKAQVELAQKPADGFQTPCSDAT